MKTAIRKTKKK